MAYEPTDQELEALSLIQNEVQNWEEGEVFVTDTQSFLMKNLVKNARMNYFGIFKHAYDKVTKRKKVFIPLTEKLVEDIVKNIDIDTSNIKVKAKNGESITEASIFRYVLFHYLDKIRFGKIINHVIRLIAIDGTAFVKTWKEGKELKMRVVDRLSILVDPSANTLDETPITERNFLSIPEFHKEAKANKWDNWQEVKGDSQIQRNGFGRENDSANYSEIPMIAVYERYGYVDKFVFTGNEDDRGTYEYAMMIATGIEDGEPILHKIKKVSKHPYTMFKFKDIWNRLDGRGVAEMVFNLQAYINEIVNTRMNTARVAALGLFKLEGGITPQQFAKLFSTSAIKMKSRRDNIERLDTGSVDPSSYREEEVAKGWAIEVSGSLDERNVTASTPATNALIQERGVQQGSNLVQENLGFSFEELLEDHVVPIIKKLLTKGQVVRITGNAADFEKLQEPLIDAEIGRALEEFKMQGGVVTPEEVEIQRELLRQKLSAQGEDRTVKIDDNTFDTDYSVSIELSDEKINPALVAQQITQALGIAAQFPGSRINVDQALREIFDAMGLDGNQLIQAQEELGEAQVRTEQALQQQQLPPVQANEATANPTPASAPVV